MGATTAAAASSRAVGAATIAEAFRITAEDHPDRVAVRTKDDEVSLTWSELRDRVDALARGLHELGVRRGDTVALMLGNRPEFHIADLAAMTLGATPFSIYATSSPEQISYVVGDAKAKVAVVEELFLAQFRSARAELPELDHVVLLEGAQGDDTLGWADVEATESDLDVEAAWRAVEPEDLITLIYTSGTTGPPKGVQLVHRNLMAATKGVEQLIRFPDGSKVISWLPSAHIAERMAHHYLPIVYAMTITTCPNPREVVGYLPAVKPTWFFAVPRIWEKLKAGMEGFLTSGEGGEQKRAWLDAAMRKVELEQAGEPVPEDLAATVAQADEQLFSQIRAMLGFDEIAAVNVGAAPSPREVLVFFHAIGVPLAEIWGMSETCGAGASNPEERIKIGTVGLPSPGVELKLAEDGELLARSKVVMVGYRNLPDKTAEALDDEGWLHTGDVATIDEDGYVTIVDRKKELIINAAGKNMSPANIEAALKGSSPLIGQACVVGDGRSYITALIVLDPEYAAVVGDDVSAAVQEAVDRANATLSRPEQIKRFTIVDGDW